MRHLKFLRFGMWIMGFAATLIFSLPVLATTPVVTAFSTSTNEDTTLTVDLTPYASDADGDALKFYKYQVYKGTISVTTAGIATFKPTANYYGTTAYFTFYVKDATGASSTKAKVSITVNAVNDAPTANAVTSSPTEDVAKTIAFSATDVDSTSLTYAIVSWPTNGTLGSVSGKNVNYTSSANYNGTDSFTYNVSDGSATSNTATVSLTVVAANDAPTATAASTSTTEDTPVTVTLSGTDIDGDALTYSIYSATNGTATVSGDQATFTPSTDYTGTSASFTFKAHDGTTYSAAAATVSVAITATNDAPTASAVSASTNEDTAKSITLAGTDPDGDSLTYSIVSSPAHGALGTLSGASVTYTPSSNYYGSDSFTYQVNDPALLTSSIATVSLTVTAVNDTPTTTAFSKTINEDEVTSIDLTPYATDIDGDTLSFYEYIEYKGTVTIDATSGLATFTPTANYSGSSAYFSFYAKDPAGKISSKSKVSFTITAINDVPVASALSASTSEDTAVSTTLSASDAESAALTYQIVDQPTHGTVTLSSRTATYTPESNFNGTDTFTYNAYETSSTSSISNTATVTVSVAAVNDAPTAEDVSASTAEDTAVVLALSASDIDGDALAYSVATPTGGAVTESGGIYTYTPTSGYTGTDAFTYTVSDGALAGSAAVTVTVIANNETPVASSSTATTDEDTAVTTTLTATDAEGAALVYAIATAPTGGTLALSGDSVTYTPTDDFNGSDSFTFTASDGVNTSDPATITITVAAVNDPPVAVDVSGAATENAAASVTLDASDAEDDKLSYQYLYSDHGDVTIDGKTLSFTPDTGFGGTATIAYRASDGKAGSNTATVTITVTDGTNDAPTAKNLSTTLSEDHARTVTFLATDPEGAELTYAIATSPAHGSISVSDNAAEYTPDADFYGSDSFTYTASDGSNTSAAATVTLTVRALPDLVVDCAMTIDSSHKQTDTTSGLTYWDSLVDVVMDAPATTAQLTELITTAGGTGNVCKIELTAMSADEQSNLATGTDTSDMDFAEYRIEIAAQTDLSAISSIATSLNSLSYVTYARAAYIDDNPVAAPETDTEQYAYNQGYAMYADFDQIHLEGALEYLSAYQSQGDSLGSIALAIGDTGVCASTAYASLCYDPPAGIQAEFTKVEDGANLFGTLDPSAPGQTASMPLGLIDPDDIMHGTNVAALMVAESNGSSGPSASSAFENETWSGIVGSVPKLHYKLTSYMINSWDLYKWQTFTLEPMISLYMAATCGDDAVNSSFSRASYEGWEKAYNEQKIDPQKILPYDFAPDDAAITMSNLCNTLYVWAAGNDDKDLGSNSNYADYQYYTPKTNDNNIGVQGTDPTSSDHTRYSVPGVGASNYGTGVSIAAPGGWTSYSAPLVTGTAGLLKAINPALSPSELVTLMQTDTNTDDTDTPFLNTATAVLLAIHDMNANFVPMTLKYAAYEAQQDLVDLRVDENYTTGDHNENGFWRLEDSTLTIERESTEMSDAVPEDKFEYLAKNIQMLSELKSTQKFTLGLVKSTNSAGKTTPFLAALPQGENTHELKGKFRMTRDFGDGEYYDRAVAYGFKLGITLNEGEAASENTYLVPLTEGTAKIDYTAPFKLTDMQLTGYLMDEQVKVESDTATAANYDGMDPLDPTTNIVPEDADNSDEFTAWEEEVNATTFASQACPNEGQIICDHNGSECCDVGHPNYDLCTHVATEADCTDYEGSCSVVSVDDTFKSYYKFNITFDDVECDLSLAAGNIEVGSSRDVEYDGDYFQQFYYYLEDAGSPVCTVTAHIDIDYVGQGDYVSYGSAYAWGTGSYDAAECGGEMTYTGRETYSTEQTVTFNFKDGVFPLTEVFEAIDLAWNDGEITYAYRTLPDIVLNAGSITPGIGIMPDSTNLYWSHGIGPMKRSPTNSRKWELDEMQKLDRSIP